MATSHGIGRRGGATLWHDEQGAELMVTENYMGEIPKTREGSILLPRSWKRVFFIPLILAFTFASTAILPALMDADQLLVGYLWEALVFYGFSYCAVAMIPVVLAGTRVIRFDAEGFTIRDFWQSPRIKWTSCSQIATNSQAAGRTIRMGIGINGPNRRSDLRSMMFIPVYEDSRRNEIIAEMERRRQIAVAEIGGVPIPNVEFWKHRRRVIYRSAGILRGNNGAYSGCSRKPTTWGSVGHVRRKELSEKSQRGVRTERRPDPRLCLRLGEQKADKEESS